MLIINNKILLPCAPPAGRLGLWKDVFTVSMNDKFESVYRQKMGKSDLTFDFGVWGATSPPYTAPPLSKPHICNWQVHRSTQIQSLHLKMNTIVELLKKKRKKEKTSQNALCQQLITDSAVVGLHSWKYSYQQTSLSSYHHSVFPLLCIDMCIYIKTKCWPF